MRCGPQRLHAVLRRLHLIEAACSFAPPGIGLWGVSELHLYDKPGLALLMSAFVNRVYVALVMGGSGKSGKSGKMCLFES